MLWNAIVQKEPIHKGWSCDKKFCAQTADGTKYLLRLTPHEKSGTRRQLFDLLGRVAETGLPMCLPVEFGSWEGGTYTFYTWIDGADANEVIPGLSPADQYALGLEAGRILQKIHSIPAPAGQEDWASRFGRKANAKIQKYRGCGLHFSGDETVIRYLTEHREVLEGRPQTFQHGDYHIGNMMLCGSQLIVIDFDRFDFGDPWEEFNRIVWCAQVAPPFASGMVDGYFDGDPPPAFWQCLAFYIGSNTLSSVYWAIDYGEEEIQVMLRQAGDVMDWYDGFQRVIPGWYSSL